MVGLSLAPKWLILAPFGWMNHQKSKFLLISYTLSVRGCWGQPMLLFWKPRMHIKNLSSQHSKTTFKQDFTSIFLSVRANSLSTVQCEIPCSTRNSKKLMRYRKFDWATILRAQISDSWIPFTVFYKNHRFYWKRTRLGSGLSSFFNSFLFRPCRANYIHFLYTCY